MGKHRIKQLKPGMVLAEDVRDVKGRLLLAKGNPIGTEHIRIFKIWGIAEIEVMGENEPPPVEAQPALDPAEFESVRTHTERLFQLTDRSHPAVSELFNQALSYRVSQRLPQVPLFQAEDLPRGESPPPRQTDFLQKFIEKEMALPEIPLIVNELNEIIANPLATADQIAQVINKSPSLTALMLKVVNSSFYGLPTRVDRVSLAVTLIGTRELSTLALGISIISMFKKIPSKLLNMKSFLQHSLACGIFSRLLAAQKNLRQTEQMFTAGLLHDLGRLIVYIYFPDDALGIMRAAAAAPTCLYMEEKRQLGCDHAYIGQYLLNQWRLPLSLENAVGFHHQPSEAPDPLSVVLVHLADMMTNALGFGTSGEHLVPPLDTKAWDLLGLHHSRFELVVQQAVHQIAHLEFLLQP
jgi:HD-like signal output (HDOD) protein